MVTVAANKPMTTMMAATIVSATSPAHDVDRYSPTYSHRPHTLKVTVDINKLYMYSG